jgi:hypothetical protein
VKKEKGVHFSLKVDIGGGQTKDHGQVLSISGSKATGTELVKLFCKTGEVAVHFANLQQKDCDKSFANCKKVHAFCSIIHLCLPSSLLPPPFLLSSLCLPLLITILGRFRDLLVQNPPSNPTPIPNTTLKPNQSESQELAALLNQADANDDRNESDGDTP